MSEKIIQPHELPSVHSRGAETSPERHESHEQVDSSLHTESATELSAAPVVVQATQSADVPYIKDPELIEIENILAEGMEDFFRSLKHQQQLEFKESGESAAKTIRDIIHRGSFRIKDIVLVIVSWLKTLPGINKFFLEQEAKIKADKIIDHYK